MADEQFPIEKNKNQNIEIKKSRETIGIVGIVRHWLYSKIIPELDGIYFTQEAAQILLDNKMTIFDLFCLFRDLKYDFDLGIYHQNMSVCYSMKYLDEEIKKKKKTISVQTSD
ncbi:MAG: hypothetical protein EPN82_16360 [Bacteroidetes bacterium]|nr:MAG: hypothetical protein EPN82_16360 [Bacteroidota bacterium]